MLYHVSADSSIALINCSWEWDMWGGLPHFLTSSPLHKNMYSSLQGSWTLSQGRFDWCHLFLKAVISSSFPLAPSLSLWKQIAMLAGMVKTWRVGWGLGTWTLLGSPKASSGCFGSHFTTSTVCLENIGWHSGQPFFSIAEDVAFLPMWFQMPLFQNRLRSCLSTWHKKDLFCLVVSKDSGHGDLDCELRQNIVVDKEVW